MKVITAPDTYNCEPNEISIFLAGGITGCPDWQSKVIQSLKDSGKDLSKLVVFNPRRAVFNVNDPNAGVEQIDWEFHYLSSCNIFSMYFCGGKSLIQPICLYELGRYCNWKKWLVVSVEAGYEREFDVIEQLKRSLGTDIVIRNSDPITHAKKIIDEYQTCLNWVGGDLSK